MTNVTQILSRWRGYLLTEAAKSHPKITASIGDTIITLEVLSSQEDHETGFMFRDSPSSLTHGLLFLYSRPSQLSFWMKNVKFDIELLALDAHNRITQIEYLISQNETPVKVKFPCSRVIEMPAGFCKSHHVKTGDIVRFTA